MGTRRHAKMKAKKNKLVNLLHAGTSLAGTREATRCPARCLSTRDTARCTTRSTIQFLHDGTRKGRVGKNPDTELKESNVLGSCLKLLLFPIVFFFRGFLRLIEPFDGLIDGTFQLGLIGRFKLACQFLVVKGVA